MVYNTAIAARGNAFRIETDDPAVILQLDGVGDATFIDQTANGGKVYELPSASAQLHFPELVSGSAA